MVEITFVVPVGDPDTYDSCFRSSPLFTRGYQFQIIAQRGFRTAGQAFNDTIGRAEGDVIVFAHQDVLLPGNWAELFLGQVEKIRASSSQIGVLGCVGITSAGQIVGHVYRHDRELNPQFPLPAVVETLDEHLISFLKSNSLRFDARVPSFFGYAVDLCLQARLRGLQNFAIDAPCFHQAKDRVQIPGDLYASWNYLAEKWERVLPVQTPSGVLKGRRPTRIERLRSAIYRVFGYTPPRWWGALPRINPEELLQDGNPRRAFDPTEISRSGQDGRTQR